MPAPRSRAPRNPRALPNPARSAFRTDRLCPQCEFNLIGLYPGMVCPECGAPIVTSSSATAGDENLASAPRHYLIVLSMALGAMSVGALIGGIALSRPRPQGINATVVFGSLAAFLWAAGVFVMTQPRPVAVVQRVAPRMQQRHARWVARLTQAAWMALPLGLGVAGDLEKQAISAAATTGAAYVRPLISVLLSGGAWTCAGIGVLGLLVVCYLLSDLAEWASDSPLAERFRLAALGAPIGIPLAVGGLLYHPMLGALSLIGLLAGGAGAIAAVAACGTLFIGLLQMTHLSVWAIKNREAKEESLEHREERDKAYDQEMIDRLDPTPIAPQPNLGTFEEGTARPAAPEPPLIIPTSEHVVPKPDKAQPYQLSEE